MYLFHTLFFCNIKNLFSYRHKTIQLCLSNVTTRKTKRIFFTDNVSFFFYESANRIIRLKISISLERINWCIKPLHQTQGRRPFAVCVCVAGAEKQRLHHSFFLKVNLQMKIVDKILIFEVKYRERNDISWRDIYSSCPKFSVDMPLHQRSTWNSVKKRLIINFEGKKVKEKYY